MNVHQLRVFLAVSDCMNISQVADRYFTSRQSIRYSIKSLEKDLGVSLFDVSNNKLVLTPNGAEVAEMARRALDSYRQLQIDYVENVEASSHSIAVSVDFSLMTARDTITSFYLFLLDRGIDGVAVSEDTCEECLEKVISRESDVAVARFDYNHFLDSEAMVIRKLPFGLIVHRDSDLAQKSTLVLSDLEDQKLIVRPGFSTRCKTLISRCQQSGIRLNTDLVIRSSKTAKNLVCQNIGSILTSSNGEKTRSQNGDFCSIPLDDPDLFWYDCIVFPRGYAKRKNISAIIEFFKREKESALPDVFWENE